MRKSFYMLAVVIASLSLMSCFGDPSDKGIDYSDLNITVITYQVPGDGPHQYIKFGYSGAHYPECKYCAKKMKEYNFLLKDGSNITIQSKDEISYKLINEIRVYLSNVTLKEAVSNPNFKDTLRDKFELTQIRIIYSNNI